VALTVEDLRRVLLAVEGMVSLFVDNNLNQSVNVQIKANRASSTSDAVLVGSAFTVSATGSDARSLSLETSGKLPYIYVELKCTTAPTSGSVTVWLIKGDTQVKLVDALEIRDTVTHTPDTDPTKCFIKEW